MVEIVPVTFLTVVVIRKVIVTINFSSLLSSVVIAVIKVFVKNVR